MKYTTHAALLSLAASSFLAACSTLMPGPPVAPMPAAVAAAAGASTNVASTKAAAAIATAASGLDGSAWTMALSPDAAADTNTVPTLRFGAGRISGSDGCNRFSGPYTTSAGQLQFGSERIGTMMACSTEDDAQRARGMDGALTATRSYRIEAGQLVLLDAASAPLMSFNAQATALAGTDWNVSNVNNGNEAVVSLINGTMLMLAFGHNGKLSGFGGCNNFSGPYRSEGDVVTFGPMASTRMQCTQPEGVMAQEAQFLRALESVTSAQRDGNRLELRTASGALAASLSPARP